MTSEGTGELTAQVAEAVAAAVAEADARVAADPDLVHGDVVEELALAAPLEVAVALCEQAMGFVPDTVRQRLFEAEHAETIAAAAAVTAAQRAEQERRTQRSTRAAATRARTLAAEAAAESAKVRSAACPTCFQVRSPAGVCGCD